MRKVSLPGSSLCRSPHSVAALCLELRSLYDVAIYSVRQPVIPELVLSPMGSAWDQMFAPHPSVERDRQSQILSEPEWLPATFKIVYRASENEGMSKRYVLLERFR